MSAWSSFSDVDGSSDPARCIEQLDYSAKDLHDTKARLTALTQLLPDARWLDLGCGLGHDLTGHPRAVGLDASMTMLKEARRRLPTALLLNGDCHALPLVTGVLDACRIERVLQHVRDPVKVLGEVRRCLRPGGRVALFEPDWSSLTFPTNDPRVSHAVIDSVVGRHRHGRIGSQLGRLLADLGFGSVELHEETVAWTSLDGLRRSFRFDDDVARVGATSVTSERVDRWLANLAHLEAEGDLRVALTRHFAAGVR